MKSLRNLTLVWFALTALLTLLLMVVPRAANAQNVPTYVEQSTGNVKQATGVVVINGASDRWLRYVPPTGGITNSTAGVVVFSSQASRNIHVMGGQCYSDALGAATDLELREGTGGSAIWRTRVPTAGIPQTIDIKFNPPLRLNTNVLLEMATATASVTGGVYCNWQGYSSN